MSEMNEAIAEFIGEADEQVERISLGLNASEKGEMLPETINSIYRDIHTIKGSAQLFGFQQIGLIGHAMETSLDPVRKDIVPFTSDLADALFEGLDIIVAGLKSLKSDGAEPDLSERLESTVPRLTELTLRGLNADTVPVFEIAHEVIANTSEWLGKDKKPSDQANVEPTTKSNTESPQVAEAQQATPEQKPKEVIMEPAPDTTEVAGTQQKPEDKASETIRVQVSLLDNLMNLVGELVLIRNQVLQKTQTNQDHDSQNLSQRLNVVTTELQNEVMKTRMQPIGNVLTKFHRVVRDLSKQLGKKIELRLEGTETELDKTLIEAVKDPLTHVVRNCVDHGLELPDVRAKAGKEELGTVLIRSYHEGGQVIVEISDDGRGLDPKNIGAKAIEKNIVTADRLGRMTDREINNLIFAPGFSTVDKVSDISGRGVGMDVVKTNIERIGGMIELNSVKGSGTTLRLKIPLTLAIVPALVVRSMEERFAIPQVKLVELLRLEKDEANKDIEMLQGRPVYRLRGKLLPILSLNHVLQIAKGEQVENLEKDTLFNEDGTANIVVLNADDQYFGLLVEQIDDSADIVVKPLAQFLKSLPVYSGATVMGDGSVALTLDVMGIAEVGQVFETSHKEVEEIRTISDTANENALISEYLLVDVGAEDLYGIPLASVNRLEEFSRDQVHYSGEREVVKYRESLLPLISVPDFLDLHLKDLIPKEAEAVNTKMTADLQRVERGEPVNQEQKIHVVVVKRGESLFGLQVNRIQDVVKSERQPNPDIKDRKGILGNIIRDDNVYVILDTNGIIEEERRSFSKNDNIEHRSDSANYNHLNNRSKHRVLVAEDSPFFRRQMRDLLLNSGYQVETAKDGSEALNKLENPGSDLEFSLLISDIEMPILDGYELATKVRKHPDFSTIPMVAVTTRFRKDDVAKGEKVGFNRYLEKLNAEEVVATIDSLLLKTEEV